MSEIKSVSEQKKEDWMNSKWRPMMGWMYMVVCMMDMVIFPVLWSLLQTFTHSPITQWNPLTLQGAGLFHIAMGAVLGIAAFGRTQEKLGGANNGGAQIPASGFTAPSAPATGFGTTAPSTSFTSAPSWGTTPTATSSFGGGAGVGATAPTTPAVTTPSTPTSTFALSDTEAAPSGTTMGIKRPQI
jgi:hypothetical protein